MIVISLPSNYIPHLRLQLSISQRLDTTSLQQKLRKYHLVDLHSCHHYPGKDKFDKYYDGRILQCCLCFGPGARTNNSTDVVCCSTGCVFPIQIMCKETIWARVS